MNGGPPNRLYPDNIVYPCYINFYLVQIVVSSVGLISTSGVTDLCYVTVNTHVER